MMSCRLQEFPRLVPGRAKLNTPSSVLLEFPLLKISIRCWQYCQNVLASPRLQVLLKCWTFPDCVSSYFLLVSNQRRITHEVNEAFAASHAKQALRIRLTQFVEWVWILTISARKFPTTPLESVDFSIGCAFYTGYLGMQFAQIGHNSKVFHRNDTHDISICYIFATILTFGNVNSSHWRHKKQQRRKFDV